MKSWSCQNQWQQSCLFPVFCPFWYSHFIATLISFYLLSQICCIYIKTAYILFLLCGYEESEKSLTLIWNRGKLKIGKLTTFLGLGRESRSELRLPRRISSAFIVHWGSAAANAAKVSICARVALIAGGVITCLSFQWPYFRRLGAPLFHSNLMFVPLLLLY